MKKLRAVRANAGVHAWFRKRLDQEIDRMHRAVFWWVRAAYRKQLDRIELAQDSWPAWQARAARWVELRTPIVELWDGEWVHLPPLAMDAAPADLLEEVLAALRARWGQRFDRLAEEIAESFAKRAGATTDQAIEAALRAAGMRVKFQISKAQSDQLAAAVQENVALIRSIPEQYLLGVEGAVMRSVREGRNLAPLVAELQKTYGSTKKRAALIARDQNNKATAFLTKTRQLEIGVEQAVWVHSGAGKEPRPSHVKAGRDQVVYNVAEGWLDPALGKRIWPGTEINCRCTCRSIIPELVAQEAEAA